MYSNHIFIVTKIDTGACMSKKVMVKNDKIEVLEQNIILKILRLLAQENLISLEEEMRGEKIILGDISGC